MQWTPELSGLATNRKPDEYLPYRESEEDALKCLFKMIPAESASKIYLECVNDVLKTSDNDEQKKEPIPGTWSRLVLLGNRITDKSTYPDVDENLRRRVVSSITGTFCSASCYNNPTYVAVILCLARRALMNGVEINGNQHENALERYHAWFRDLLSNCDVLLVKGILEPLTQLLPLESHPILKLHHRVFSANKVHFRLASEYVAQVRTRIRDFDPGFVRSTVPGDNVAGTAENINKPSVKMMKEIIEFVSSYAKSNKTLPKALEFQMNFHRHHFHKVTLPILTHPDFVVLRPKDGDGVDLKMTPELFDERRLDIINELAFKRKDQAITKAEAKAATLAIRTANKKRKEERKHGKIKQRSKLASEHVQESSGLLSVIEAILKDETEHGFNATQVCENGLQVRKAKDLLTSNIVNMVDKCQNKEEDLASVGLEILQCICSAIESIESKNGQLFNLVLSESREVLLEKYSSWWATTGRSLLWLVSHVIGDPRLVPLHIPMRCHLFALICCRTQSISKDSIHALAMIIAVLIILRGNPSLCDLCFVMTDAQSMELKHLGFVVFENLPLLDNQCIGLSSMFILDCIFLLSGFTSSDLLGIDSDIAAIDRSLGTNDEQQQQMPIAKFVEPLMCTSRWLVSNPWRMKVAPHCPNGTSLLNEQDRVMSSINHQVFLKAVHALSELGSMTSAQLLLKEVLSLELRCQWGKAGAITKFFHALRSSGTSAVEVVHHAALFLAIEASSNNFRNTEWILLGLQTFHDEIRFPDIRVNNDESAVFQVEQCTHRNGPHVAFRLLEYYRLLEYDYFRGSEDIGKHIQHFLLKFFWPLPKRLSSYFMRCLKRVSSRRCHISTDVFMVANFAIFHDCGMSLESAAKKNGHKRNDLYRKTMDISLVLDHLTNFIHDTFRDHADADVNDENVNGSAPMHSRISSMITSVGFDHAFTLGISIGMHIGIYAGKSIDDEKVTALVHHVASTVVTNVEKVACCDVLDCAIIACAMLPFGRVEENSENIDSARKDCVQRTNKTLCALVDERVLLCNGDGRLNPFWARDILGNAQFNLERKNSQDVTQVLSTWDNQTISRCIARILGVVGSSRDAALKRFVTGIGHDSILSIVLPNLIWAYSVSVSVTETFGSLLRDGILRAIRKLSLAVDHLVDGGALDSLAGRFGNFGVEVVSLINSGMFD